MKTNLFFYLLVFFSLVVTNSNAQTTVTNGSWSSPATWGGVPPMGTGVVVINHTVTLDTDYNHTGGSVTIGSNGSLIGNSAMRLFVLNYPSGTATLTVNGIFNVPRVPLFSNTTTNNGVFQADSLLSAGTFINNASATLNANQFLIDTGSTLNNNGSIVSMNFLNLASITSAGVITTTDFKNAKNFINASTGIIYVTYNFSNDDSLGGPAIFTNDGNVFVEGDWYNGNQINGSGKFCVSNNTWNTGTMTGTLDFCDQTGGNIDLNTGTIAATITYCLTPCSVGMEESSDNSALKVYPNPFFVETALQADKNLQNATLTIDNLFGQTVMQLNGINGQTITLCRNNLPTGLYLLRLTQENKVVATKRIAIID